MPVEVDPPQPEEVLAAIDRLVARPPAGFDPWWAAGLAQALRGDDGAAAEDPGRGSGVIEP
jgi:hypothetical protein